MKENHSLEYQTMYRYIPVSLLLIAALLFTHIPVSANRSNSKGHVINPQTGLESTRPQPPTNLVAKEMDDKSVELTWQASAGAVTYKIYRSKTISSYAASDLITTFDATNPYLIYADKTPFSGLQVYYYVITAVNSQGESNYSNQVTAFPHFYISWIGGVQAYGPSADMDFLGSDKFDYTLGDPTKIMRITGEINISGHSGTENNGPAQDPVGQFGFGPAGSDPNTEIVDLTQWTNWIDAAYYKPGIFNAIHNDRYLTEFLPKVPGEYYFTYRFSTDGGRSWKYCNLNVPVLDPKSVPGSELGHMNILENPLDTTPPTFLSFKVSGQTKNSISLSWTVSPADTDILGFDVYRSSDKNSLGVRVNKVQLTKSVRSYVDQNLISGSTYYYRVVAFDNSFNKSTSIFVTGITNISTVTVKMQITIPPFTTGQVYINREYVKETSMLGKENWEGLPVPCNLITYQCELQLTIQENFPFTFRFSRGSAETIQTHADGNSPAIDPSFTVKAGMATVKRVIENWDDPIAIASQPTGTRVPLNSQISVTWNQSMPSSTVFVLYDTGSSITETRKVVPGSFVNDLNTFTTIFTPDTTLYPNRYYSILPEGQLDTKTIPQLVTPDDWTFFTDKERLRFPLVFKQ